MNKFLSIKYLSLRGRLGDRGNPVLDCFVALLLAMTIIFTIGVKPAFATNTGQFTAEVWVKPTSSIASQALLGKAEELRIFTDASGYVGCQIKATTWQTAAQATTTALTLNQWAHVACTYDKSNIRVYLNGTQIALTALTSPPDDTANAFKIGQDDSASTPYSNLTGTVDNFQFYNYARTTKQVVEDMNAGEPPGGRLGAVGYWKFDEGQGTTANNSGSQGSTLNGTLTGMSSPAISTSGWTPSGKFGKALIFDGSNDYVDLGNNTALNPTTAITVSTWYKPVTFTGNGSDPLVDKGYTSHTSPHYQYHLSVTGDTYDPGGSYAKFGFSIAAGGSAYGAGTPSGTWTPGNWYHVVGTYDGSTVKIYVNGKLISSAAASGAMQDYGKNAYIGKFSNLSDSLSYLPGTIDEVKIYPYALTADEVKTEYNQGQSLQLGAAGNNTTYAPQAANQQYCVPGDTTSCVAPVAEWNFEEGSGTSVKDTSGNNNTGTWAGTGTKHWDVGKVGKAGKFNGSDDYVDLPNDIVNGPAGTVSFWFKADSVAGPTYLWVFDKTDVPEIRIFLESNFLQFVGYDNSAYQFSLSTAFTDTSNWHYVSGTWKDNDARLFLDGIQIASDTSTAITHSTSSQHRLGYYSRAGTKFKGKIDQVRVFNYARSAAQIAWDYNRGAPVGHWQFDECQGSVAHDISDNSNHGTITIGASGEDTLGTCTTSSTAWGSGATGKYNSSLSFDGTDDYVDVGNITLLKQAQVSVSAWVKLTSYTADAYFVSFGNSASDGYHLGTYNGGGSNTFTWFMGGGPGVVMYSRTVPSLGVWYHVVGTDDGTTRKIYVNGVLENSGATNHAFITPTTNFIIGRRGQGTNFINGQIDDVKIFNYALTPLQIKNLYNNGAVFFGPVSGSP